jgi:hypothetical protein
MSTMSSFRTLPSLTLALAVAFAGGARADEDMARDLVPAQKPLYELGGISPESGLAVDAWVDRPERTYTVGQRLKVFVRPKETSYITVLNVGSSGRVAVIFPNFFQRDMQVSAGQTVKVPADGAGWRIEVAGPPGVEVIKVIASREPLRLPELLRLANATAKEPILSLGRSGDEVARDLAPQIKDPAGAGILSGGVKSLLVRVLPRAAAAPLPHFESPQLFGLLGFTHPVR